MLAPAKSTGFSLAALLTWRNPGLSNALEANLRRVLFTPLMRIRGGFAFGIPDRGIVGR